MFKWLCTVACFGLTQAAVASQLSSRIDLDRLLREPSAMEHLLVVYMPNRTDTLYIHGSGYVVLQSQGVHASAALLPTCRGHIASSEVRSLVQAMRDHHFFDLPEKDYMFQTASDLEDDYFNALKLHTILVDDGKFRAERTFAEGAYQKKPEPIPDDFAAVEILLRKIREKAIQGPCKIAPGIRLPEIEPTLVR